jgi:protein-tyrosine sulfotransferase
MDRPSAIPAMSAGVTRQKFALIVGGARCGTTILRLILDAHPTIACPAEAGIPALMGHMASVWAMLEQDDTALEDPSSVRTGDRADEPPKAGGLEPRGSRTARVAAEMRLSERARQAVLQAVLAPMEHYCSRERKRIYCDKSLDSVHHLDLVRQLFPEVRCVLLFRHVMDTVASGIEASPWGFQAFGYAPFVQAAPGNFVAALVNYWLSHVESALAWEEKHPEICHRVRYEDLVIRPERTLAGVFKFLGVEADMSVLERAFERASVATGPGDYKVVHTTAVHAGSIGRGKRVPVGMIPPPLLEAVNTKLEALGYEPLGPAWNAEPRAVPSAKVGVSGEQLAALMGAVQIEPHAASHGTFAVVAEDNPDLRWVINPAAGDIRSGDGEVESVLIGATEDLALMIAGKENAGVLLRSGRVRYLSGVEDLPPRELATAINGILRLLGTSRNGAAAGGSSI